MATAKTHRPPRVGSQPGDEKANTLGLATVGFLRHAGSHLCYGWICLFTVVFLFALDKNLVDMCAPDFGTHVTYSYINSYTMTHFLFHFLFGKIFKILDTKATFLTAVLLFVAGSVICGTASSTIAFVIGRASVGLGAAGIQEGAIITLVYNVRVGLRSRYRLLLQFLLAVSSLLAIDIGVDVVDTIWSRRFYLKSPFGFLVLLFSQLPTSRYLYESQKNDHSDYDDFGLMSICLCLAVNQGVPTCNWCNGRFIALLAIICMPLLVHLLRFGWTHPSRLINSSPKRFIRLLTFDLIVGSVFLGSAQAYLRFHDYMRLLLGLSPHIDSNCDGTLMEPRGCMWIYCDAMFITTCLCLLGGVIVEWEVVRQPPECENEMKGKMD